MENKITIDDDYSVVRRPRTFELNEEILQAILDELKRLNSTYRCI